MYIVYIYVIIYKQLYTKSKYLRWYKENYCWKILMILCKHF